MSRNAVAAAAKATRATPVRRPARRRTGSRALNPHTGLVLIAVGLVLLLAVRVRTASVDLQTAGFILAGTGLTWLWVPVTNKRTLLRRIVDPAIAYLTWDGSEPTARGSLADLLAKGGDAGIPPGSTSDSA